MHRNIWRVTQRVASNLIVVFSGVAFYLALSHFDTVMSVFHRVVGIISPFIWGLVLAYLLDGAVRFFEQKVFKNSTSRVLPVLVAYVIAIVLLILLLRIVIPQLAQSVVGLVSNVPAYMDSLSQFALEVATKYELETDTMNNLLGSYEDLVSKVTDLLSKMLPQVFSYSMAIGSGVVTAITALISSVYMLLSKNLLLRQMKKVTYALLPLPTARKFLAICRDANETFGGFIIGKILDSAIIGALCFVGLALLHFPYALLISVIVGVTNVIPFFGPFIGAIPSFFILLIVNPINALEFLVFILVLQQLDGNVIGPRILGDSTGLPALWVLVAIIVGQGLFGVVGMIIGVPAFAVIFSLFREFVNSQLARKGIDEKGEELAAVDQTPVQETPEPEKTGV